MKKKPVILSSVAIALIVIITFTIMPGSVDRSDYVRESLEKADSLFIYEGLPHQMDVGNFESEKKRDDLVKVASYLFYDPVVRVGKDVSISLKRIAANGNNYRRFSGEKKCGGFHPDYALSWKDRGEEYFILFCYGCGEAKIIHAKKIYRYDLEDITELEEVLQTFQLKRPRS